MVQFFLWHCRFSFRNDENNLSVVKYVIHCKNEFVISTMQIVILVAY